MRKLLTIFLFLWAGVAAARPPIIDMHVHALAADDQGPPPLALCSPIDPMPVWDQKGPWIEQIMAYFKNPPCKNPVWSPTTDDGVRNRSLAVMQKHNVIGVVSGKQRMVAVWQAQAPERVIPSLIFNIEDISDAAALTAEIKVAKAAGKLAVIGELGFQYDGISADDPRLEPLWQAAEAADVPVAIHIGPGPPGIAQFPGSPYRARLSNPLQLEPVLARHPMLRVNVMHAGFPMLDDTLALLYAHPQVHLDVGVIVHTQPRAAFYRYLRGLVEAGFGNRIMFGSDQMVWPETIERSIAVIEAAPFLSKAQKRAILYDNAARFLRLDAATIARHQQM